jgi:hypothetical protein
MSVNAATRSDMPEHEPRPTRSVFAETFGLAENEILFNRFGDARLQTLLDSSEVTVHSADVDRNSYGEFLFLTLSKAHLGKRLCLTCYGLGYHEPREMWLQGVWSFYQSDDFSSRQVASLSKTEVQQVLARRRADVERWAQAAPAPSQRALLFGILAELTDEDGALSELEELDEFTEWLGDEPE